MDRPIGDLDFVIEGDAPALARDLAAEVGGVAVVHHAFRTATVSVGDDRVDIVTARSESYPRPGALPKITPGTIADDLARRDLSINAMALPLGGDRQRLLDPNGGARDLSAGVVRTLHDRSFVDDPTRVFRAARYEQRLGFRIDDETACHLERAVACGHVKVLSPDRVRHEIERVLNEAQPALALGRLAGLGVLAEISESWSGVDGLFRLYSEHCKGNGRPLGSVITPMMYLAALVYPLTPGRMESLVSRLNMPNSWSKVSRDTLAVRDLKAELSDPALPNSQTVRLLTGISEDALLAVARVTSSAAVARRIRSFLGELKSITPALDGDDLLELGAPSGPQLGRILDELFDAKLDGGVNTIEDEHRFVREALVRIGDEPGG